MRSLVIVPIIISIILYIIIIVVVGCAGAYTPGSFLAGVTYHTPDYTHYGVQLTLWDAETGQNYTTTVVAPQDIIWSEFVVSVPNRIITLSAVVAQNHSIGSVYLYKYLPRQAPMLVGSCAYGNNLSGEAKAFYVRDRLYAIDGNDLYNIKLPLQTTPQQTLCQVELIPTKGYIYADFSSGVSIGDDHISYNGGNPIVQLWFDDTGYVNTTYTQIPNDALGTFNYFWEDHTNGDFYNIGSFIEFNFYHQMYHGHRANGYVQWTLLQVNGTAFPLSLDTRDEQQYNNAPLFCSIHAQSIPSCVTLAGANKIWTGVPLQSAFYDNVATYIYPVYDPSCN
eukprot:TRINITY_DN5842_c0_g1_i1.p1 TRINITY_DN5842_c0_g1~~TRINITY_DN5842_c0_g1_i1.p1  ORF type:complete len:337 (+),score=50.96 TRINITY_DN5842_c0_g1_i1:40-1050(+)